MTLKLLVASHELTVANHADERPIDYIQTSGSLARMR